MSQLHEVQIHHKNVFTPEQESVLAQVEAQLAAGFPIQGLTKDTGLSSSDLEKLLNRIRIDRNFSRDIETSSAINALALWLEKRDQVDIDRGIAETPTFKKIQAIMTKAHHDGDMIAITGGVGIGKSEAAKHYVSKYPRGYGRPGAMRIQFDKTDKKDAAALGKILAALRGNSATAYRNGHLMEAIGEVIQSGDCLILDECNFLGEAADIARCLYDDFQIPVIMIGNPDFSKTVWGKHDGFAALANRAMRFDFMCTTEEDVEAWLNWKGLSGPAIRKAAIKIAARPGRDGGLRTLAKVIRAMERYYGNLDIDESTIDSVAESLGIRV